MKQTLQIIALTFLLLAAGAARAGDQPAAERLNEQAKKAYNKRDFGKALGLFKQAYETHPDPRYLYNAAMACSRKKDHESAIFYFLRYLTASPKARDRDEVEKRLAKQRKRLKRKKLVQLNLTSTPPGAALKIDGATHPEISVTPAERWLKPGTYKLRMELKGYGPEESSLTVGADGPVKTSLTLQRIPEPAFLSVTCSVPGATLTVDGKNPTPVPIRKRKLDAGEYLLRVEKKGYRPFVERITLKEEETATIEAELVKIPVEKPPVTKDPGKPWRRWGTVAIITGGAAALTGAVLYSIGATKASGAQDDYEGGGINYSTYRSDFNSGRSLAGAGLWTLGAGVAVAAGGGLLYFLAPKPYKVTLLPSPGGLNLGISW